MGTQFWWFYDVLAVSMTIGILYAVISKGFNKVVYQLAAFMLAILCGIFGADFLAPRVYRELFQEKLLLSAQTALAGESFDIYERVAEGLAISAEEEETPPDALALHRLYLNAVKPGGTPLEDWYLETFSTALVGRLGDAQRLHPIRADESYVWLIDPDGEYDVLQYFEEGESRDTLAELLVNACYKANYTQLVRLSLFLMIELVMLIICSIISSVSDHLDQQMHLRRGNHLLAVPVAVLEAVVMLFVVCVTVRLITQITDGEMLLFNQPTIDETFLFRKLYRIQELLLGS